ncbi:MAG: hypothetical protein K0B37_01940 [Bacteroidales bacterium]|nr:hypothetical protein [Bacteroidales bacterium]
MNEKTTNEYVKFYSLRSISIATFLGGPIAAGILIRRNFLNLNDDKKAVNSLFIGILSTILLFVMLFSLPETTIDKIPSSLIPAIYTGLIYLIANKLQGQTLQEHKDSRGEFYSAWRAAGIGLVFSLLIATGVIGYIYASEPDYDFDIATYEHNINLFIDNEAQALIVFDKMGYLEDDELITEFKHGKNLWKQNVVLTSEILALDDLPKELEDLVSKLKTYSELRITFYDLFVRAYTEETYEYGPQIESIALQIERVLNELD